MAARHTWRGRRDPAELSDGRMGGLPVPAHNPRGLHAERWRHVHGCGRFFNALRDTTHRPLRRHLQRRGKPRPVERRLPDAAKGGRIDRRAAAPFRFDGAAYEGLAGDTLASALLANGVHLVGRSFKYHRPRGIVTAGAEEPNALVTVRS